MILAFDTSMAACSAAVYDPTSARVLASRFELMERGHAEALAPMVKAVMDEAEITFGTLETIAVTRGPGTFTGVRIGLAMARGLALGRNLRFVSLTSLEAIAANAIPSAIPVVVATEAGLGEVYFSYFDNSRIESAEARKGSPSEAAALIVDPHTEVLGTAAESVLAAVNPELNAVRGKAGDLPDAARFVKLAATRPPTMDPPSPLYIRPPDAKPQAQQRRLIQAGPEAAALLASLHGACFDRPWTEEALRSLLGTPGSAAWIVSAGGEPTGFTLIRAAADEAEILTLAVIPARRRLGHAAALVAALKAHAGRAGLRHLHLEVAASNEAARKLYAKAGFSVSGERKGYYAREDGPPEAAILMRWSAP
ncbi:MAG: tRNA (adenosine(37)-N6)-threonylcarbamoyltransferase complex dimerization subunit type 1 TsaB [Aestuariivirga sp.]